MTICPQGWYLPTQAEWNILGDDAKKLKATTGWKENYNGTDDYGFSALPGCEDNSRQSCFHHGDWWSARESYSSSYAYYRFMLSGYGSDAVYWNDDFKTNSHYVRCLKDN
jgi:uncharacterized protein (TIGR02145 family)